MNEATWGAAEGMNALEALMWRAEGDPRLRSTIFALELLDSTPDWDRSLRAHEWATRLIPRFRQRVVEPPLGLGVPSWQTDPDFDLHYHVRRLQLPGGGSWAELLSTVEQIAMTPFDRVRAPWEAHLIEGVEGGGAAYLLKLHHATTDGVGGIQLFEKVHSRSREPTPGKDEPPPPVASPVSLVRNAAGQLARDAMSVSGLFARSARQLAHPRRAVGYASSLRRVLGGTAASGSPLLSERSLSWRLMTLDVAFADLRGAAKAVGASLNDAYLAGLLGGFRLYHEELGEPIETLPVGVPISLRASGDGAGGNSFAGARIAGPVAIDDPVERMAAIGKLIRAARDEPAVDGMATVAPALSRLPAGVISQLAGGMTKDNDLQASNIPGMREDVYLAGAKIERFYGFGPLPGCACMCVMITHGDTCCMAINIDPAAITDRERFGRCLVTGFQEVLSLHPGAASPVLHP